MQKLSASAIKLFEPVLLQKKYAPKEKKFGNFYLLLYLEEIWF